MAARNIPPPIQNTVAVLTVAKGIGGVAAERREPVVIRDVQTDDSGLPVLSAAREVLAAVYHADAATARPPELQALT